MTEFVSSHSKQELCRTLKDVYKLQSSEHDFSTIYEELLRKHKKEPLGASSTTELATMFAKRRAAPDETHFYVPNSFSFTVTEQLSWLYHVEPIRWSLLAELFKTQSIKTALLLAPVAWQLGALFFNLAKEHYVTVAIFDEANPSSAQLLLSHQPVELLVTTSAGLQNLLQLGLKADQMPKTVMLVEAWGKLPLLLPVEGATVFYDLQHLPGFSIAKKATPHQLGTSFTFTPSDDYLFELTNDGTFITSLTKEIVPLVRYKLSHAVQKAYPDKDSNELRYR